ncbi:SDR family NAD(P)-dependent oxidoreductase [Labedella populi]|uniref:SDR family NAD(P)-dependent oxidoreductase n=1 Tax=Labedella populi TaxID=2498850 RepID=A0A3S3ZNE9_9MICO|nr:SDR family NAD(P)-dependent oxidoreductase [Labedella populi]RWZ59182.1 SDR family NAD(P)-dependent oxidoreductase [Labedella populi]
MGKSLGRVVVITGASSGIGRAAAHRFASEGARLVLAARSADSLEEVADECRARGAEALVVVTDVSDERQVDALAFAANAHFGRIDVWVANASVFSYGSFEETPPDVFRQVIETNLFGVVYSARAALPFFRAQGGGSLVITSSLFGKVTAPYVAPYTASKHATFALAQVLQEELKGTKIRVSAVLPATIDTPIYQHSADSPGVQMHPLPPLVTPKRVAKTIVRASHAHGPRTKVVGNMQGSLIAFNGLAPESYKRAVRPAMRVMGMRRTDEPQTRGNVFEPGGATNSVTGGWARRRRRRFLLVSAGALALLAVARALRS